MSSGYFCEGCGWHECRCLKAKSVIVRSQESVVLATEKSRTAENVEVISSEGTLTYCPKAPNHEHHQIKLMLKYQPDKDWWCTWCGMHGLLPANRKAWNG